MSHTEGTNVKINSNIYSFSKPVAVAVAGAWVNSTAIRAQRVFLERSDCAAKGPIKQRTQVLTAANAFT